jgi:hypothetical protein
MIPPPRVLHPYPDARFYASPLRVVLSLEVRLSLQAAAANSLRRSMVGQTDGSSSTIAHRPNSVPKNSLQRRAIPQSCDKSGGTLGASSSM